MKKTVSCSLTVLLLAFVGFASKTIVTGQQAVSINPVRNALCDQTAHCDNCWIDIGTQTLGMSTFISYVDVVKCDAKDGVSFSSCLYTNLTNNCQAEAEESAFPGCENCKWKRCWTIGTAGSNGVPAEPTACPCVDLDQETWSNPHTHKCT